MTLGAGARNLTAYSDSQLVTNHIDDTYDVQEDRMKIHLHEISKLKIRLKSFQLHQIPCTENNKVDYLTRLANCNTRTITANEEVDVINKILVQGIKTKLEQALGQWIDAMPSVLWSYRTTPRS
ncbi:UNVERIFIED_CONTAM: hypothetical protein Sradi_4170900 [Sesamum radiatum]|uniref:RNase H type-1 domain-containing protein n=1 Tax=Sesamum radiatum TaxID=300843 RepID=A0AAW2P584_SESRA